MRLFHNGRSSPLVDTLFRMFLSVHAYLQICHQFVEPLQNAPEKGPKKDIQTRKKIKFTQPKFQRDTVT